MPQHLSSLKEYSHAPNMLRVGYLTLATGLVLFISYTLRLSPMGRDVGQNFPTAKTRYCMHWFVRKNNLT